MTFLPAPINHGIKFQRIDIEGQPIVEADVDNVVDLSRGTTIEKNGARVNTVEHTLAALVGLEIDNVLIQLDGPEPPIMDGSSIQFVDKLLEAELEEQNALRNFFEVTESVNYKDVDRDVEIAALPLDDYRVTVMVDYNSPVLGSQHASITSIRQFVKEIASARTFCFLHELEMLYKQNLIKGGDVSNAIVIVDRVVADDELNHLSELLGKDKITVQKK
jgi:UDP-3-O-[3-hydroxymyristoyl] N-acetylglucosamine deacetylase/3-hydroxyacyl-[acyl-carrier-protein] dehydratase